MAPQLGSEYPLLRDLEQATTWSLLSPSPVGERLHPSSGGEAQAPTWVQSLIPATPGTDPGRDLSAARACRRGAAPWPAASGKPCTEGRGPRWGHRARSRRTAPRTLRGPGRAPGGVLGLPCPLLPEGGRRARRGSGGGSGRGASGPRRAAHARTPGPLPYLVRRRRRWEPGAGGRTRRQPSLTWAEVRGPGGPRLTWQALPSLLPSPPGRGAEVAREGRAGEPGAAGGRLGAGSGAGAVGFSTFCR